MAVLDKLAAVNESVGNTTGPFKGNGDRAWMVYDDRAERLVALPLHRYEVCTLAYTLNVAI